MGTAGPGSQREDSQPPSGGGTGVVGTDDRAAVQQKLVWNSPRPPDCPGPGSRAGMRRGTGGGVGEPAPGQEARERSTPA